MTNGAVTDPLEPSWSWLPLQSFFRRRSSGSIGFSAPGSTLALAEPLVHPVFLLRPCLRTRLLKRSSHGVSLSFTAYHQVFVAGLSTNHTSPGVLFPDSASRSGRLRPLRHAGSAPRGISSGLCRRVPPRRLRCRSQVFSTSQRPLPPPTAPPYFRRVSLLGFPLQGIGPPE